MPDWLAFLVTILAGAAAVFGYLVLQRVGEKGGAKGLSREDATLLLREEAERIRRANEEQARVLRQELGDGQRAAQEASLAVFRDLGKSLGDQSRRSGEQLSDGLRAIEARLEAVFGRQASELAAVRQDLAAEGRRLTEALLKGMIELRSAQAVETEVLARRLVEIRTLLDTGFAGLKDVVRASAGELDAAGDRRQRALAEAIGAKFGHLGATEAVTPGLRDEVAAGLKRLDATIAESLSHLGVQQVARLEQVSQSLRGLVEAHEVAQRSLRQALDAALEAMRQENASKLEDVKRLKELEAENARLRRAIADLTLDKITLTETLKGKS